MINRLRKAAEEAYNTGQDVQVNAGLILALLDRLEAAEKDAARYRWMRDSEWNQSTHPDVWTQVTNEYGELDEAIDAAMGEQK